MKSLARWCSLAAGALLIAGCNSPGAVLKGKVRLAGKPLAGGSVIVHAGQDQKIRGLIAEDGSYEIPNLPAGPCLLTVHANARMPEGMHLKQVLPPTDPNGPLPPGQAASYTTNRPTAIPKKFTHPEESGLATTIKPGEQTFDIELK